MENTHSQPVDSVRASLSEVQNQLGSAAAQAKDRLSKASGQVQDQARETAQSVVSFTKERPLAALGIAIGAGLLIGALLKSRK